MLDQISAGLIPFAEDFFLGFGDLLHDIFDSAFIILVQRHAGGVSPRPGGHVVNGPAAPVGEGFTRFVACSGNWHLSQNTKAVHVDGTNILAFL